MGRLYLILAVLGAIVPYYFFISFVVDHGFDLGLFVKQLLANEISTFFAVDLVITAVVFLVYSWTEARRRLVSKWWVYAAATLLVGPLFALPLFLYAREQRLAQG